MPLGIDEMPMIKIVKGIQIHTVAIAAPVSNEAVGTTPILRGAAAAPSTGARAGVASGLVSVTATMPSTYGPLATCDTAFSREPAGGKPPGRRFRAAEPVRSACQTRSVATEPLISHVSDTARWVATYRAVESALDGKRTVQIRADQRPGLL